MTIGKVGAKKTQWWLAGSSTSITPTVSASLLGGNRAQLFPLFLYLAAAETLEPVEQIFDNIANITVPDCHGNELRLSDCPTRPTPDSCRFTCAVINCVVPSPIASSSIPPAAPQVTETLPAVVINEENNRVTPQSTTSPLTPPPSSHFPSLTNRSRPSDDSTSSVTKNPETDISNQSEFIEDWNNVVAIAMGAVMLLLVMAGVIVSAAFIACGVKRGRRGYLSKTGNIARNGLNMQENEAYFQHRRKIQMNMERNPAYFDLPPEPVYEEVH